MHYIKNNCSKNKKQRFQNGNAVEKINDYLFENWLVCDRCLRQTKGATRAQQRSKNQSIIYNVNDFQGTALRGARRRRKLHTVQNNFCLILQQKLFITHFVAPPFSKKLTLFGSLNLEKSTSCKEKTALPKRKRC